MSTAEPPAFSAEPPSRVARFLVADDDGASRTLIGHILRRAFPGCEVRECRSGEEALEWLESHPQDALITDFNLPRMSGALLALELRKKKNATPIVILSNSERSGMASIEAGADAFLTKDQVGELPRVVDGLAPEVAARRAS